MFELKSKEWAKVTWMKKRTKRFPGRSENLLKETDQSGRLEHRKQGQGTWQKVTVEKWTD